MLIVGFEGVIDLEFGIGLPLLSRRSGKGGALSCPYWFGVQLGGRKIEVDDDEGVI